MKQVIEYKTQGTCCQLMRIEIEGEIIKNVEFYGGCNGNLQGIRKLIMGMDINYVSQILAGIRCGDKTTSCPDQLSKCLKAYIKEALRK